MVKIGDRVKIIDNTTGHCFKIGDIVTITHDYGGNMWRGDDRLGGNISKEDFKQLKKQFIW